jgi:hypothetical protein
MVLRQLVQNTRSQPSDNTRLNGLDPNVCSVVQKHLDSVPVPAGSCPHERSIASLHGRDPTKKHMCGGRRRKSADIIGRMWALQELRMKREAVVKSTHYDCNASSTSHKLHRDGRRWVGAGDGGLGVGGRLDAIYLTLDLDSTSAPALTRASTLATCPSTAARDSAVPPCNTDTRTQCG